jgi:central kinetochore subunit Mis15/CHL4
MATATATATVPDYKNVPHSHRLPVTHRDVQRTFTKLSRQSLLSLAQQWLSKKNRDFCRPFLLGDRNDDADEEEDDLNEQLYEPAQSYEELLETYRELAARKGGRREVLDRILEGDWRTGVSMYMLATAEIQYLLDHPSSLRWTARRLTRIPTARSAVADMEVTNDSDHLPRFQAQTFMSNLARELTPLRKAHYLNTRINYPARLHPRLALQHRGLAFRRHHQPGPRARSFLRLAQRLALRLLLARHTHGAGGWG